MSMLRRLLPRGRLQSDKPLKAQLQRCESQLRRREEQYQVVLKRNEALKARIQELMQSYRDARSGQEEVDPVAHNSTGGMDTFFTEIPNETPYVEFGHALAAALVKYGVRIDGRSVADIGTGPGLALRALLEDTSPASVTGYDFSEAALLHARLALPMAKFHRHDIYVPLEQSYDLIFCTEVLEHLERPRQALDTMLRALTPNGTLVLTTPDGRVDFSRYHINFWSPESWRLFVSEMAPDCRIAFGRFRVRESAHYANNLAILDRSA